MINDLLSAFFWGNTVSEYLLVVGGLVSGVFSIKIFKKLIISKVAQKLPKGAQQSFQNIGKSVSRLLYLALFYICLQLLDFPPRLERVVDIFSTLIFGLFFIHILNNSILDYVVKRYAKFASQESGLFSPQFFSSFAKVLVWVVGLLILADNVGLKITPLIAGLGIGGVGIALASQVLLKDLFSCFAIYFDRPFNVGDFIIVGDYLGTVEHIGIKTTRLRSLGGEQLILSNSDLTESRVRNYKRMQERRVLFSVKVTYATPLKTLQKLPEAVKDIIDKVEGGRYDRAHLASFEDRGFVFEIVYYVLSGDYTKYMDVQQEINFAIVEYFSANNIVFSNLGLAKNIYVEREG